MAMWNKTQDGEIIILFGKHKLKRLHNIPDSYLNWVINMHADDEGFEDDEELIVEVEKEMKWRKKCRKRVQSNRFGKIKLSSVSSVVQQGFQCNKHAEHAC